MVSHERGKGESSFKWKKRSSEPCEMEKQPDCTLVFVEPMKWMQAGTCKFPSHLIIAIRSPFV